MKETTLVTCELDLKCLFDVLCFLQGVCFTVRRGLRVLNIRGTR